jgi:hypothetical protein
MYCYRLQAKREIMENSKNLKKKKKKKTTRRRKKDATLYNAELVYRVMKA